MNFISCISQATQVNLDRVDTISKGGSEGYCTIEFRMGENVRAWRFDTLSARNKSFDNILKVTMPRACDGF